MKLWEQSRFEREAAEIDAESWLATGARWPCPWIWHELDGPWHIIPSVILDAEPDIPALGSALVSATAGRRSRGAVNGLIRAITALCIALPRVPLLVS